MYVRSCVSKYKIIQQTIIWPWTSDQAIQNRTRPHQMLYIVPYWIYTVLPRNSGHRCKFYVMIHWSLPPLPLLCISALIHTSPPTGDAVGGGGVIGGSYLSYTLFYMQLVQTIIFPLFFVFLLPWLRNAIRYCKREREVENISENSRGCGRKYSNESCVLMNVGWNWTWRA
jgi:hypothetical protein